MVWLNKHLLLLAVLCLAMTGSCSRDVLGDVPADFSLVVDTHSATGTTQNVNIRINAQGEGQYERYETGGVIRGDAENWVTYEASQVMETGEFQLSENELNNLWSAIEENHFFELTGDYRMARGFSYAFLMVEANGRQHQVFNIGMELPEIKAIVEATDSVMPVAAELEYREGFVP